MPVLANLPFSRSLGFMSRLLEDSIGILKKYCSLQHQIFGYAHHALAVQRIINDIENGNAQRLSLLLNKLNSLVENHPTLIDDLPVYINDITALTADFFSTQQHIVFDCLYNIESEMDFGIELIFDALGTLYPPLLNKILLKKGTGFYSHYTNCLFVALSFLDDEAFKSFIHLIAATARKLDAMDSQSNKGKQFIVDLFSANYNKENIIMFAIWNRKSKLMPLLSLLNQLQREQKEQILSHQITVLSNYSPQLPVKYCPSFSYRYTALSLLIQMHKPDSMTLGLFLENIKQLDAEVQRKLIFEAIVYTNFCEDPQMHLTVQIEANFSPYHWHRLITNFNYIFPSLPQPLLVDILQSSCPELGATLFIAMSQQHHPILSQVSNMSLPIKTGLFLGNGRGNILHVLLNKNTTEQISFLVDELFKLEPYDQQTLFFELNGDELAKLFIELFNPIHQSQFDGQLLSILLGFQESTLTSLLTTFTKSSKANLFMTLLSLKSSILPQLLQRISSFSLNNLIKIYFHQSSNEETPLISEMRHFPISFPDQPGVGLSLLEKLSPDKVAYLLLSSMKAGYGRVNALMAAIKSNTPDAVFKLIAIAQRLNPEIQYLVFIPENDKGDNALLLAIQSNPEVLYSLLSWISSMLPRFQHDIISKLNSKGYSAAMQMLKSRPECYGLIAPIIERLGKETIETIHNQTKEKPLIHLFFSRAHGLEPGEKGLQAGIKL